MKLSPQLIQKSKLLKKIKLILSAIHQKFSLSENFRSVKIFSVNFLTHGTIFLSTVQFCYARYNFVTHGDNFLRPVIILKFSLGRIIRANLSRSQTQAKFYLLIASLSVILLQLQLTILKLEVVKSDFHRKKERYEPR